MSQNADIIGRVAGYFRKDPDALLALLDPDIVMDWSASRAPYAGVYEGKDEIRHMWKATEDAWDEWDTTIVETIEPDAETVVIVTHIRARGQGSGVVVDAHGASVWKLRDGLVTYAKLYQEKAEALEAIRPEQAGT